MRRSLFDAYAKGFYRKEFIGSKIFLTAAEALTAFANAQDQLIAQLEARGHSSDLEEARCAKAWAKAQR